MIVSFPPPPPSVGAIPGYLQALYRVLVESFSRVISANEGAPRVILQAPNGTLYTVTVDDAGALQVDPTPKGGYR
jgi:hypothetical protein